MELYFRDRFFSSGTSEIMDASGSELGCIDLKSAFGSSLDIYDSSRNLIYSGKFRVFSNKWNVLDPQGETIGIVRSRMSFLEKKFEYQAGSRGIFTITSPAFSRDFTIVDEQGEVVAGFEKVSGFFSSGAYRLHNNSSEIDSYELIAVIMGVHSIRKRQSQAANSAP
ncbi:hypothetical protein J45TS6_11580 [Paenibacillus sp. J45TS6]|uniref:hypothetical protein n=1 Tax=Paenibacillus sp. J45TS6 TaxID=2807196 RepID=UPI001B0DF95D|nr:hypothetical protein [Paenibacillus sp. J45TS6]GIP42699.1 hypothetical protein J45TS6_11580 [Paenibacillus sp. J45TS6]